MTTDKIFASRLADCAGAQARACSHKFTRLQYCHENGNYHQIFRINDEKKNNSKLNETNYAKVNIEKNRIIGYTNRII